MAEQRIQQLKTPKGINVWLVESHQIPMVSVEVAFRAGSAFDPAGKFGLANFTASLMDEGAGKMNAQAFKEALDDIGARFGVSADTLDLSVNLNTLTEHKEEAFRLLGLAVREPRFDQDATDRVREAILTGLRRMEESPNAVAQKAFNTAVYGDHAYGHLTSGTPESVAVLTPADMRAFHAQNVNRANMVVSVVGDITPADAMKLVDSALADLTAGKARNTVAKAPKPTVPVLTKIKKAVPQASIMMGHLGVSRDDPNYYSVLVMNELLGGGILTSRLFDVVREKNGLAYDVRSANVPLPHAGMFMASVQTDNAKAKKAVALMRSELKRIADTLPTEEERDDVVNYMVGSFPLRTNTNGKILNYLSFMQMENLGVDYLTKWPERVGAISRKDIQNAAKMLIKPEAMAVVIVGDGDALKVE